MSPRHVAEADDRHATHRKKADSEARPIAIETGEERNSTITGGPGIPAAPDPMPARMPRPPHSQRGGRSLEAQARHQQRRRQQDGDADDEAHRAAVQQVERQRAEWNAGERADQGRHQQRPIDMAARAQIDLRAGQHLQDQDCRDDLRRREQQHQQRRCRDAKAETGEAANQRADEHAHAGARQGDTDRSIMRVHQQPLRMAGDGQFLVGRHDPGRDPRTGGGDAGPAAAGWPRHPGAGPARRRPRRPLRGPPRHSHRRRR